MTASELKTGTRVKIKCPTYYNGRTFYGTIAELMPMGIAAKVIIDGNIKTTNFALAWMTKIN